MGQPVELPAAAAVAACLRPHGVNVGEAPRLTLHGHGHSNLTMALASSSGSIVLRSGPPGVHIPSAHDMAREYRVISALASNASTFRAVPEPLAFVPPPNPFERPFYAMSLVEGVVLRNGKNQPDFVADAAVMQRVSCAMIDAFADLHRVDLAAVGLADFGKPEGYIARQVRGWAGRYEKSQTDDVTTMNELRVYLERTMPEDAYPALLHGDFKYDNVVLDREDPARLLAVLDWEMAALGDARMDLGTLVSYWIEPGDGAATRKLAFGPTWAPGNLTRAEIVERYAARTGTNLDRMPWFHCFALYKLCVVAQQLYARFAAGKSQDPRLGGMLDALRLLSLWGVRCAEAGAIVAAP
jgi:aminoglycoside phosphotransferase (APT) family kinase protein